jgi:hypothetical protein
MSDNEQLTRGAIIVAGLVARLGASVIGRKVELTEGAVRSHATGGAVPRERVRARYRAALDVPLDSWDSLSAPPVSASPPSTPAPTPAPTPARAPGETPDALEAVMHLLDVARAELEAARADALTPPGARAALITAATGLCRLLARLSGQLEVTEIAILRSQPWARAMALVREVLRRHPAAAADLDEALARFANGGDRP